MIRADNLAFFMESQPVPRADAIIFVMSTKQLGPDFFLTSDVQI